MRNISRVYTVFTPCLIVIVSLLAAFPSLSQTGQTVTWSGGNTFRSWMGSTNWTPGIVPLDDAATKFTVVVPDSTSLRFDSPTAGRIEALSFGAGSQLLVTNGQPIDISGVAVLKGLIDARGVGSAFRAPANTIDLSVNPRLTASDGAKIQLGASTYKWQRYNASAPLLSAIGAGSLVDLSSVSTLEMTYGDGGAWTYSITARSNGIVDLSSLNNLYGPGQDDVLEINADTGASLRLNKVQNVSGNLRFKTGVPLFEMPEAVSMVNSTVYVTNGGTFQVPKLTLMNSVAINLATNSSFLAATLSSMTDDSLTLANGSLFEAPQLRSVDRLPITFSGNAAFVATNLSEFKNSDIIIIPGRRLDIGTLTNINGSFVSVSGGTNWRLGALTYDAQQNLTTSRSLLSADGLNTVLDASSLRSVRAFGGHGDYDPNYRNDHYYYLSASFDGTLDLSGLETAVGADPASYNGDDYLVFRATSRGTLLLPNLRQVTRNTRFEAQVPIMNLPALQFADSTVFSMANGSRIDAPVLGTLTNSSFEFGFNSTLNAPALRGFVNSELNLAPGRILIAPPFTNVNLSRLTVSGGSTLTTAALSYETRPDWRWSPTLLSADGAGSRLSLSSMESFKIYGADGGAFTTTVSVNNSGEIDLSGVRTITGPVAADYSGDDWLNFSLQNGGKLYLARLTEVTGHTRFSLGAGTSISAPDLQRLAGGVSFVMGAGSSFAAPNLVQVVDSDLTVDATSTYVIAPLTNIDYSRLSVSGGQTLRVAAQSYEAPQNWRFSAIIMQADGPGSLLDASAMKTIRVYGGHGDYDPNYRNDHHYRVLAQNQSVVDLSGMETLVGADPANWNGDDSLTMTASGGALIKFGPVLVTRRTFLSATGNDSTLQFQALDLRSPSTLNLGPGTILRNRGDFRFNNTDVNSLLTEFATVQLDGSSPQQLEVGGKDIGPGTTAYAKNFAFSQLVLGSPTNTSLVKLVDTQLNAGRGPAGEPEALYLHGLGGQGLRLLSGSRLVMNGIPCYAAVNSAMVDLRTLIPAGMNSVAFDGGWLANMGGPAITNLSPVAAVTPPISSVEVSFNIPIQASSFTVADVTITGPGGSIAPTSVQFVAGTKWRISFPPQTVSGNYTVRVGPSINEAAANFIGMDQNGDGLSGTGASDAFTGTFTVDGIAPGIISAIALQGGNSIGIRFNEPVADGFATNPVNFTVNGSVATKAVLQNGTNVVLTVAPLVGESFTLLARSAEDLLGNKTDRAFTGTILNLSPVDMATAGATTVTFDGEDFQTIVGGGGFLWTASDAGQFVSERRTGDFDLRAQITRLDQTEYYCHAGIMWRESLAANSRQVSFFITPPSGANNYFGMLRATSGTSSGEWSYSSARNNITFPNAWIRLQRLGSIFIGYRSTNGLDWIEVGRVNTTGFPSEGFAGMATSARNTGAGVTTTALYDNFSDFSPSIVSHPQSQTVTSGTPVVFAATARGVPTLAYQWYFNGQPVPGGTGSALSLPAVSTANVGDYRLAVSNNFGAVTSQVATLVVDGIGLGGFEGDLSPAPNGNNTVTVADWVKAGRLVAKLDAPLNTSEFVRADSAPRMTGSTLALGDGRLTVADWTQAGRYAAGLDPVTAAGGPTQLLGAAQADAAPLDNSGRVVTFMQTHGWLGRDIEVPVQLTSQGNENAVGFSFTFNPEELLCLGVLPGNAAVGSVLQVNLQNAASGIAGVALSRPIGQNFPIGTLEVARVRFAPRGKPGERPLTFADAPVYREVVDPYAQPLPAAFVAASVLITEPVRFTGVTRNANGAVQLILTGPAGQSCEVQASTDLLNWITIATPLLGSEPVVLTDSQAPAHNSRLYRVIPRQ